MPLPRHELIIFSSVSTAEWGKLMTYCSGADALTIELSDNYEFLINISLTRVLYKIASIETYSNFYLGRYILVLDLNLTDFSYTFCFVQ